MKNFFYILFVCVWATACRPAIPEAENKEKTTEKEFSGYDSLLAKQLGADEYGMKKYVMALLKKGQHRNQDSATAAQLQIAHLDNIQKMADEGKLVVAGPFFDDWEVRGIYIFNTASVDSAKNWTDADPAVQAGRLEMELHPFYCSAALMKVNDIHRTLEKKNVAE